MVYIFILYELVRKVTPFPPIFHVYHQDSEMCTS